MVFSTRCLRCLRDATIEDLLEEVLSMQSVPRLCNGDQLRLDSLGTAVRRVGGWCEMAVSVGVRAASESPGSKDVNTEATAFVAVTRRQPVKIHQIEKL
jgi:hypothetical protein